MNGQGEDQGEINNAAPQEPVLECLEYLCRHFGHAQSAQSIKSRIAYDGHHFGPKLFCEAANEIGLNAQIVKKAALENWGSAFFPSVIFLKNNQLCVLLAVSKNGKAARVYSPEAQAVKEIALKTLQEDYAGYCIPVHPRAEFDKPEILADGNPDRHWFWGLVRESWPTYMLVIVASVFINLFALVSPLFTMNVYDRVLPNNAIETGWVLGIGALVAFSFDFLFRTTRGYLIDFAGRRTDVLAARRIYDQVLNMRLIHRPASSGAFANMLRDFDSVREFFTSATITALVDLPFALIFLFFVYKLAGGVAFLIVGLIAFVCIAGYLIQYKLKYMVRQSAKTAESKHALLIETIHGIETVRACSAQGRFRARYAKAAAENAMHGQKSRLWSALGVNIAAFVQQSSSVIIILGGMYLVQDGKLTVGGLIACVILGSRALAPIGQIANLITRYYQASSSLTTLEEIMSKEVERPASRSFLNRADLSGKIEFDKVSFAYQGADVQVLDSVGFTINAGEHVGIIGRIGSGKSTIAKLMLNLYEPNNGRILFDDTDSRQIDPADLRRNMAYIAQETILFQGSIRENIIASNPSASEAMILEAAQISGVHEFVSRHPMGYDMPVGEFGAYLSGGQRQSVALARAIIGKPNIFICDEPTNAMDTQAEAKFCEYLKTGLKGRTVVLVTHKQNMLPLVDRLILIHYGRIVMDDTRDRVLAALQSGNLKVAKE